jgi:hypothetical protein
LLLPADGALIDGENSAVLLSWTASELLPADTYYVVLLTDEAGEITTYWTQATSYRLPANLHPSTLTTYAWYVVVMEEIGVDQNNIFYGNELSLPSETHTFSWR